jgi:GNAT superfamily N-acetyltransferase
VIREERDGDRAAVRAVEVAAFGRDVEADIVDALRGDPACARSLVAEFDGEIVGHLLLHRGSRGVMTLGPLAVLPEHQGAGIGSALMREGRVPSGVPARHHQPVGHRGRRVDDPRRGAAGRGQVSGGVRGMSPAIVRTIWRPTTGIRAAGPSSRSRGAARSR